MLFSLGRADPECVLGHLLKILFKNDDFMNTVRMHGNQNDGSLKSATEDDQYLPVLLQLVNIYVMTSREFSLNAAACRLLHNIMPGLETAVVFQEKVSCLTINQRQRKLPSVWQKAISH